MNTVLTLLLKKIQIIKLMITNGNQSRIYEPETQNLSQRGIKAYQHVIFNLFKFILNLNETNEI